MTDLEFALELDGVSNDHGGAPAVATRRAVVEFPAGIVGDPTAAGICGMDFVLAKEDNINRDALPKCRDSAIGWAVIDGSYPNGNTIGIQRRRLWRVATGPNEAAAFATSILGLPIRMGATVSPSNGYRIKVTSDNISQAAAVRMFRAYIWGVPADHQGDGGQPPAGNVVWGSDKDCDGNLSLTTGVFSCALGGIFEGHRFGSPLPGAERTVFMRNGSVCDEPLDAEFRLGPWGKTWSEIAERVPVDGLEDCDEQPFAPTFKVTPERPVAGQPSGYTVAIEVPQNGDPDGPATAHVKDVSVALPKGLSISPPSANGLGACTDAQLNLNGDSEPACPVAASIGSLKIETPVLDEPVTGRAYLGSQLSSDPASGDMYRLFLVAKAPGVLLKLKGAVKVDPETGQLVETRFENNPQLPFDRIELRLDHGQRASLVNPKQCGTYTASATLTSHAGHTETANSSFEIDEGCGEAGFSPTFAAGTTDPSAGGYSSFSMRATRPDGDQEIKSIQSIRLPEGLLGNVGSVPLCADAQAAVGSCGESSRVGHVQIAAGAGLDPLWVPQAGKSPTGVYLTGPYKGAPYGLAIKVPAQTGPFDLGTVAVRSALQVDERTAAISTGIDETRLINPDGSVSEILPQALPRFLKGVGLDQLEIRVILDRENFVVNPTSCAQKKISAELSSVEGDQVDVGSRFRAIECASLGFAPKFRARILDKGRRSTLRSFHPRTQFTVVPRKGDANIAGARVVLPSSTLLDQANIGTTCTRAQMAERNCPEASIVGYAKAWSPLLSKQVEGPVYLAANGGVRPLPDLAAVLDGEIRVVLQGEIATRRGGGKARLQNTFRVVPDAPVSRFVLTMRGGAKRGLLVNSTDLCRSKERGAAVFTGQNGLRHRLRPRIATSFNGCAKVRRQAARRSAQRKLARKAAVRSASREVR